MRWELGFAFRVEVKRESLNGGSQQTVSEVRLAVDHRDAFLRNSLQIVVGWVRGLDGELTGKSDSNEPCKRHEGQVYFFLWQHC